MLNKRTEIINKCRHRRKCALARFDSMDRNINVKFLVMIEIFEAFGGLIYSNCEADSQKFHLFQ